MSGQQVFPPYQVFTDEDGDPLENGYIYIGQENLNPQVAPIEVFWDPELTILAAQPIRTLGGYPSRNGSPSRFFVKELVYSITVKDKKGELVFILLDAQNSLGNMLEDDDVGAGAALIARGDQMVNTVADLRLLNKHSASQFAVTQGYYAAGDGGSGRYYLDALDIVTPDNGGNVIVAADGARWKLLDNGTYDVKQFGAKPDWNGTTGTDNAPMIQAAISAARDNRKDVYLSPGDYMTGSTVVLDNSSSTSYIDPHKINIRGAGIHVSRIIFLGVVGAALSVLGGNTAGTLPMQSFQRIQGFGVLGTVASGTYGIYFDTTQHITLEDVEINSFDFGLVLQDVDFASFRKCIIHWNNHGIFAQERSPRLINSTRPNGLDFIGCQIGGNGIYGAHFLGGSCINFYGGDVEGNGLSNGVDGWGLLFEKCGIQGGVGANLNGVYFEENKGVADAWFIALDLPTPGLNPYHCVSVMESCDFHRPSATNFVEHNVVASFNSANAGKQKLAIRNCAFKGFGSYVPDVSRAYVHYAVDPRNAANLIMDGCIQQDDVETVPQNDFYNVSLNLSGAQNISSGLLADIAWTGELYDADGMHVTNAATITAPVTGKYIVSASAYWQANASGVRTILIIKNGATEVIGDIRNATSTGRSKQNVSRELLLNKGDTIGLRVFQDSGSTLTADADGTFITMRSLPY